MHLRVWGLVGLALAVVVPNVHAADAEVKGTFTGNGKPAQIAFVSSYKAKNISVQKPVIRIVFTEKDHSKDENPDWNFMMGRYGSAFVVMIHPDDGKIVECDLAHAAHSENPISALGSIEMKDFKNEGGILSGHLITVGEGKKADQTWQVDVTFRVKTP